MVLLLLIFWNFWTLATRQPGQEQVAALPYSVFIAQARSGNVASVSIRGVEIEGAFKEPLPWPPAHPVPSPTPSGGIVPPGEKPAPASAAPPEPREKPRDYRYFRTVFPEPIGDPGLLPLLESQGVQVRAQSAATPWFVTLLLDGLPLFLLIGYFWWMGRQALNQRSSLFGFGRQKGRLYAAGQPPQVTFADVAGADSAKQQLQEEVDFLRHPKKYHEIGARIPRGVLLVGPPGTGKTLLARAVAGEAGVAFFSISGSEFVEMFVGVGASRVRDLFEQAKQAAPAIVFIDELDAVGRKRGAGIGTVNDEREQTLNQLLVEMDGFEERQEAIVLAATNRPDVLDSALLRPGRFDRQIVVPLPDVRGREGILKIHARRLHLAADVDLPEIARTTIGLSGAQLANLCNEAALIAARHNHGAVAMADFRAALDKIVLGDIRSLVLDPKARRTIAYHESGHALVAWLTPQADPVYKVTIVPHGQALGITEQRPEEERYNYPKSYLLARLDVMLGGRTAEEIVLGDITTGAENDLVAATRLARHMMVSWGMGDLGPVAYQPSGEERFLGYELGKSPEYSETTAARIDQGVQALLGERHAAVQALLSGARAALDRLAAALLDHEAVEFDELAELLGPRPGEAGAASPPMGEIEPIRH
jgi:cell division protease FtsH